MRGLQGLFQGMWQWMLLAAVVMLQSPGVSAQGVPDFTMLVERYSNAVVSVTAEAEPQTAPGQELPFPEDSPLFDYFRRFFEGPGSEMPPPMQPQISLGSGFIISSDGYVLTNSHVVSNAGRIMVGLTDQREFTAKLIGHDRLTDIALLKIEGKDLPVTKLGDSRKLKVGQWVLAIGSPFGLEHTATQGIISALGRSLPTETYVPFIQTDAAVNPGNSGGPLFNLDGEVVGINSQIYSNSGGYMGVSFAIPINVAMDVVQQLKTTGKVTRGWLGVQIQDVTSDLAKSFGLDKPRGALVAKVLPDSPAQKAGLKVGDIIVSVNGNEVRRSGELPPVVGRMKPGSTVQMSVIREGEEETVQATIEELPEEAAGPAEEAQGPPSRLGVQVQPAPPGPEGEEGGVLVTEVGAASPAARAGILPGDLVLRIGNIVITDVQQFQKTVDEIPAGQPVPILIQREGTPLFLTVTVPE